MIGDIAQSIRQVVRVAMGMGANSVRPADTLAGSGTQIQHMATVQILSAPDLGWPAIGGENVDDTPESAVTQTVDQLKQIVASVNFFRGGNADAAGLASYTTRAVDDAARLPQLLYLAPNAELLASLGLSFVDAKPPRDLTALKSENWESRGQVELTFYVINRESAVVGSIGSGSVSMTVDSKTKTIEVST